MEIYKTMRSEERLPDFRFYTIVNPPAAARIFRVSEICLRVDNLFRRHETLRTLYIDFYELNYLEYLRDERLTTGWHAYLDDLELCFDRECRTHRATHSYWPAQNAPQKISRSCTETTLQGNYARKSQRPRHSSISTFARYVSKFFTESIVSRIACPD